MTKPRRLILGAAIGIALTIFLAAGWFRLATAQAYEGYLGAHTNYDEAMRACLTALYAEARRRPNVDEFKVTYYDDRIGMLQRDEYYRHTVEWTRSGQSLCMIDFNASSGISGVTVDVLASARNEADPDRYMQAHGCRFGP